MTTLPFGALEGTGFETLDPRFTGLVPKPERLERLWTGGRWCEGPAWFGALRTLVWSDIPNDRMLRWDERNGQAAVFDADDPSRITLLQTAVDQAYDVPPRPQKASQPADGLPTFSTGN